jgi:hypothetical protein
MEETGDAEVIFQKEAMRGVGDGLCNDIDFDDHLSHEI